ncbi:MAG: AraC family transcriptional regulator [Actinomycetia bacterium]|nr:AraC family transcriptional regulator [Actinomycetes bacterium]
MPRLTHLRFMQTHRTNLPVRQRIRPRGVPNALQNHLIASTNDLSEATSIVSGFIGSGVVHVDPAQLADFHCELHAISVLDVTVAYLDFCSEADVSISRVDDAYFVHMTSSGEATVTIDGETLTLTPFTALIIGPQTRYRMRCAKSSPQLIVRIEQAALRRHLARMLGRPLTGRLTFERMADLTTDTAVRWHGALQILFSEVSADTSLIKQGRGGSPLQELVISTLLYMQPHTHSAHLEGPRRRQRASVRRCLDYIEQHLAEPLTLTEIAEAVGLSPRAVQAGFREDLDTTPLAYVRDRRLDRVRTMLMHAAPGDGVTVTDAAHRWGFSHLGSFSGMYRQRFGEAPSHTLRRR